MRIRTNGCVSSTGSCEVRLGYGYAAPPSPLGGRPDLGFPAGRREDYSEVLG